MGRAAVVPRRGLKNESEEIFRVIVADMKQIKSGCRVLQSDSRPVVLSQFVYSGYGKAVDRFADFKFFHT
jgi:hypothetical protein